MRIGIIDADLLGRQKHRFPNLACERISGYWKTQGADVTLILDREYSWLLYPDNLKNEYSLDDFDVIYVSKVFTDTPVPDILLHAAEVDPRIRIGGTGFYFDKAPNLPDEIEHHMPDYHLYDEWIASELARAKATAEGKGRKFNQAYYASQFKEYTDYSIGFLTRGCFRKCKFCVNQKYDRAFIHSALDEFFDESRRKICLLDDNFLACPGWKEMLEELIATGRPFKFKQGLDERLLTPEKCEMLFNSNYDGDFTFAFDNLSDYDLIKTKLEMIRRYNTEATDIKFYVLVGFEGTDAADIEGAFRRIELLMQYRCIPYIMRYQNKNHSPWRESKYAGIYVQLARWSNQPSMFKKMSFRQYCEANQDRILTAGHISAPMRALQLFEEEHPDIAARYFDMRFDQVGAKGGG